MVKVTILSYLGIAGLLFLLGIVFGKILKRDVLGNNVKLGIMNSFLLSVVWPITACTVLCGIGYSVVQIWKKL